MVHHAWWARKNFGRGGGTAIRRVSYLRSMAMPECLQLFHDDFSSPNMRVEETVRRSFFLPEAYYSVLLIPTSQPSRIHTNPRLKSAHLSPKCGFRLRNAFFLFCFHLLRLGLRCPSTSPSNPAVISCHPLSRISHSSRGRSRRPARVGVRKQFHPLAMKSWRNS